ncbi:MAG: YbaB/EbfC family nucleoid-associated protein [Gammaproteobacteria bacterium]|nr:YbaB/EbfC family nucleoid-associated protein [Gammaproteobacteria bacterium]
MNKPFGEKAGLGELMKKAQEMQKKMQEIQQQVAAMKVEGTSGGGIVKITMNGRYGVEANGVKLDPSVLKEEKAILEDLIAAAINDAVSKIEKGTRDKMSSLTGIKLPDGFDLPTE